MEQMVKVGVRPGASTYNTLAHQLMIEGKFADARVVVETEMPAAGLVPDDYMHALFERTEGKWNRMRTTHLQGLLKRGTPEARQTAHDCFDALKAKGIANKYHRSLMR